MAVSIAAPVVERIDHWTLVSTDIERTKRFYTEVLGAQSRQHHAYVIKHEDFDTWIERFGAFGVPLRFGQFGTRMSLLFEDPDGYPFEFTVPMENRDEARDELRRRGLEFES